MARSEKFGWRKCLALPAFFLLLALIPSVAASRPVFGFIPIRSSKKLREAVVRGDAPRTVKSNAYHFFPIVRGDDQREQEEEDESFLSWESDRSHAREDKANAGLSNRRFFIASTLLSLGAAAHTNGVDEAKASMLLEQNTALQWETSPINKRYGVTLYDAEKSGYNVGFITYLS